MIRVTCYGCWQVEWFRIEYDGQTVGVYRVDAHPPKSFRSNTGSPNSPESK